MDFGLYYGGITSVCSLPAFYFIVGRALAQAHTPLNQGRVGAMGMGRHALGLFSASASRMLEGAGGPYFSAEHEAMHPR